jgi:two-component system, sensor histidine kinase LadS
MSRFAACCLAMFLCMLGAGGPFAQELRSTSQAAVRAPQIVLPDRPAVYRLTSRSRFWIDPTGLRGIEQVAASGESLPWALYERGRPQDLQEKALWVQFDIATTGSRQWYLQIGSAIVHSAQLFHRTADGRLVQQEAGHGQPVAEWPVPGRYPTFQLAPASGQPVRYWLRVEQDRVDFAAPLKLYDSATLLSERERSQFLLGGYFGLALLLAVGAAANAIAYGDRIFAVFAFHVTALALGQLAWFGLGEQHLWDGWLRWNETAAFLLPGISFATGLWFARTVTEPARFSRALDLSVWTLIAALLSAAALDSVLASPHSYLLVLALSVVSLLVMAGLLILVGRQAHDPHMGVIIVGFVPLLATGLLSALAGLELLPPGRLTGDGLSVGAALGLPILFYALSLRMSHRREAEARAAALARNDALTGLAHERTLLERLDSAIGRARGLKQQCALLVLKISNFRDLAAEFGPETADRALVVAASLLRRAAADIDLEARVGDHHFALLLEGPTTPEAALNRAQELVARGLRSSTVLPSGTAIKFHVAIGLLPHQEFDGAASLAWLLEAVNAMPPDARKAIRPLNF